MKLACLIILLSCIAVSTSDRIERQARGQPPPVGPPPPVKPGPPGCKEGETVVQLNIYKYKCTGGRRHLVACVGQRAGYFEVPVNTTKTVDGFRHQCSEEHGRPALFEELRCSVGDKFIHLRENITVGNLLFYCDPKNGIQAIGCVFTGPKGEPVHVEVGKAVTFLGATHYCHGLSSPVVAYNGGPSITNSPEVACMHEGQQRQPNEKWISKIYEYHCKPPGRVEITGCVIDKDNKTIAVGQSAVWGTPPRAHHCYRKGDSVTYTSEKCGDGGAQCGQAGSSAPAPSPKGKEGPPKG